MPEIRELRLVITTDDFERAMAFYRDALGLEEQFAVSSPSGRVAILKAGLATLEIADRNQAAFIDEVEVGRPVGGQFRVALQVDDVRATADLLQGAGATVTGAPRLTPFKSVNARLEAPEGVQLTLFEME